MTDLTPIYELRLGDDDSSQKTVLAVTRSSLEIRCTVSNNEIAEKPITMIKNGEILHTERNTMSAKIKIDAFNYTAHGGMYECSTVLGDKKIRRRLRLLHRVVLPEDMPACVPDQPDMCRNGGRCGLMFNEMNESNMICVCPEGYAGETCQDILIHDSIGKNILTRTKVGVAAGGTCNLVFLFFLIVLGLLLFRERKRRRRLEGMMSQLHHQQNLESLPLVKEHLFTENPYSQESIDPPPMRSETISTAHNGKMIGRTNAVKKVIAPGEEHDSTQPHSS